MNFAVDYRADVTGYCRSLLTMPSSWLRTICVLLLAAILHVNI